MSRWVRRLDSLAAPLHRLPFATPIAEALEAELLERSPVRRAQAVRKLWQREGLLRWTGQAALRRERVPAAARRVLWITTWTTVGDAVLDLAARALVPARVELDLCIAPSLAPLFEADARFGRVYTDPGACRGDHDFLLLDVLSTASIRLKARSFPGVAFATLRGHLLGERFDRAAFADRRIRQLFGLASGEVLAPWLTCDALPRATGPRCRVAIPLGSRVPEKRYPAWNRVLATLLRRWPATSMRPCFVLVGHGPSAHDDLAGLDPDLVANHAEVRVDDGGTLRDAARTIAGCDAFLGIDGGLMHVAVAVGVPGLAVFAGADPRWFLRPGSTMQALRVEQPLTALPAEQLGAHFLDVLHSTPARRHDGGDETLAESQP